MHCLLIAAILCLFSDTAHGQFVPPSPTRFLNFLLNNRFPGGGIPLSYDVKPTYYWKNITKGNILIPHPYAENSTSTQPQCQNQVVNGSAMNAYTFETEKLIIALGLDIYDGAVWCTALIQLGQIDVCHDFLTNTLEAHRTLQFQDIRGDAPCVGIISNGECSDPQQTGHCGFCYGDNPNNRSLDVNHALMFKAICDIWDVGGTIDERCPSLNQTWKWNSYNPVLGENSWAQLIAPMHYLYNSTNGSLQNVPDTSPELLMATNFLGALELLAAGNTGGFYYGPHNMWSQDGSDTGYSISTENQASTLAGLKMLRQVIAANPNSVYQNQLQRIDGYIAGLKKFILGAYNVSLGYFVQGATYMANTTTLTYNGGEVPFAVDCQTWVSSVLGSELIDSTFGAGTTLNLWSTVKNIAGYGLKYGMVKGVGYSSNAYENGGQVFSGEWTFGAMNWLRILINNGTLTDAQKQELKIELTYMRSCIESELVVKFPVQKTSTESHSVLYSDIRYWIPFGWYANAIPALSSTSWAVFYDLGFNPLMMDGTYRSEY